jgi:hypothetical protein
MAIRGGPIGSILHASIDHLQLLLTRRARYRIATHAYRCRAQILHVSHSLHGAVMQRRLYEDLLTQHRHGVLRRAVVSRLHRLHDARMVVRARLSVKVNVSTTIAASSSVLTLLMVAVLLLLLLNLNRRSKFEF